MPKNVLTYVYCHNFYIYFAISFHIYCMQFPFKHPFRIFHRGWIKYLHWIECSNLSKFLFTHYIFGSKIFISWVLFLFFISPQSVLCYSVYRHVSWPGSVLPARLLQGSVVCRPHFYHPGPGTQDRCIQHRWEIQGNVIRKFPECWMSSFSVCNNHFSLYNNRFMK